MSSSTDTRFWSCGQEKMIFFADSHIKGCCANLKTGASPHMANYRPDGFIDIDQLVEAKRSHLAAVRGGELPEVCRDCPALELHVRAEDTPYLFNDLNIGHHTACNTDCYYCMTNSNSAPNPVAARAAAPLLPLFKKMVEGGYVDPKAIVRFGGGEPTILPEFEKLVDYFLEVDRRFFINSSGVRYSPAIERMLRRGGAENRLVISIDSATPETYEIIKGFDLSKRVWDNIARYAKIGPDILEVKYIVLPENAHETAEFIRKCQEIGVKRVSVDLDSRPVMFNFDNSLTDQMVEGIAVLIYEAKQRGMSVYQSGSGSALWHKEAGTRRVKSALMRISDGRYTMTFLEGGFLGLGKAPQDLETASPVAWGKGENATTVPLNSEPDGIYLQEDANFSRHRIEQLGIPVAPNQTCTVEVVARARGRKQLLIEFRDPQSIGYSRATFDLEHAQIVTCMDADVVAVGAVNDDWVRCQVTITPTSDVAIFNVL